MAVHIRVESDVVIVSNFGRLMDDPRHFDAVKDVGEMIAEGFRKFALELKGVNEMGDSGMGLLITLTREIRKESGEVVLISPSRSMQRILADMHLEDYWDIVPHIAAATEYFARKPS